LNLLEEYREHTRETSIYDPNDAFEYTIFGLCSEAGEVAGKYKKFLRDDTDWDTLQDDIAKELGDVMWYVDRIADEFGLSLTTILEANVAKLQARKVNNTLGGSGDER
jgi:NTP pyrophosphatase (non-canonical NTP hydrolase)